MSTGANTAAARTPRDPVLTALAIFCLATLAFLIPRDLFLPETRNIEVWLGFELTGLAALLTAPLHWAIFAVGGVAAYRGRAWVLPCAAGYTFYVAMSHVIWSEVSPHGDGFEIGVVHALGISIPGVLLLCRHRRARRKAG